MNKNNFSLLSKSYPSGLLRVSFKKHICEFIKTLYHTGLEKTKQIYRRCIRKKKIKNH